MSNRWSVFVHNTLYKWVIKSASKSGRSKLHYNVSWNNALQDKNTDYINRSLPKQLTQVEKFQRKIKVLENNSKVFI